jgi:hypothetical protein
MKNLPVILFALFLILMVALTEYMVIQSLTATSNLNKILTEGVSK